MQKKLLIVAMSVFIGAWSVGTNANVVKITANPEDCEPLLEAADAAAFEGRALGVKASENISGGEGSLKDESCFAGVLDQGFNPFSSIPNIYTAVIDKLKDAAIQNLTDFACDIADSVDSAIKSVTECSASLGVGGGFDGLSADLPSIEECGGLKADYQFDVGDGGDIAADTGVGVGTQSKGGSVAREYF
ncbi:MAG: hypothetical protein ACJAS1_003147 [Oleiphilaceae bacterium]|jgi:hypothetical protein